MIEIRDKQILIDGKPRLIIGGEVHYFRLKRDKWQDRIDKLKAAGCNAVGSYIPWLCHEFVEGQVDLDGSTRPELDLGGFIDLCRDNGLYFFARPGPFIMAEMKNEGLPYWVYSKHPEIVPVTWDGKQVPTKTLDYLAPAFLQECRHWYDEVMKVIVPRLYKGDGGSSPTPETVRNGNIIAVQLDNEVGMLSWVSNSPDLTDTVLEHFASWLRDRYDVGTLRSRYPFVLDNAQIRNAAMRAPREEYAAELMRDLGYFMRERYARYVAELRKYAEERGVKGVPLIVNVHGTDAGRGFSYPIGISQLYESYTQEAGYLAGSDHYLGDLTMRNFQDLYLINAFMEAVNRPEQPLTSVEFEAGSGDYAGSYGGRYDPSTVDFKTRMCVAQGNRLINYYLFTGGINYVLDEPVHDGNDRIAFTGERHGTAAPVNPEGVLSYTFGRLRRGVSNLMAVGDKLAVMNEERDGVSLAFIPDYYMTEYKYPESERMKKIVANLEANRGPDAWEIVVKAMLLAPYRFGAVDVQNRPLDPRSTPVLVVPSALYMDGALQQKLADYIEAGGNMLLYGEVPQHDMEGNGCTLLADKLGLKPVGQRRAATFYYLSLRSDGWAAPHAEVRSHHAQTFEVSKGEVILRVVGTGAEAGGNGEDEACGFDIKVGKGRAVVVSAAYACDVPFWKSVLERLGAPAALGHDHANYGIFMTSSATPDGQERFLHILNLDGFDKEITVTDGGKALLEGRRLLLRGRDGFMLPLNVQLGDVRIAYSTAEITKVGEGGMEFRLTQAQDIMALETDREIAPSEDYEVSSRGKTKTITSRKHASVDDRLAVRWR